MSNEIEIRVTGKNAAGPALDGATKDVKQLGQAVAATGAQFDASGRKADGFAQSVKRGGEVAGGVLAADAIREGARIAVEQIKDVISQASDLNESVNAVQKIFHQNSGEIQQWGEKNATSFGLSTAAFNKYATPLGAALKNQGLDLNQTSQYTIKLTKRAADMASVFNTDVGTALEAIQAGLRGEADPLEKFGVGLSAAKVQARALADAGKTNASSLTAQELALARLNIIFDQTADSEGDFASTSTGAANASRIMTAEIDNAKAKIGSAFLPILGEAAHIVGALVGNLTAVPTPLLAVGTAVGAVAAGFLLFAPRIKAAKEAVTELIDSDNKFVSTSGKVAVAVGKAALALTAIQVAGQAVNASFGEDLNPQVDRLARGLSAYAESGKAAGEMTRLFNDDLGLLNYDLNVLGSGGWAKFTTGFASFIEQFTGTGDLADQTVKHAKERLGALDQAMVQLVQSGHAEEARLAYSRLGEAAKAQGISMADLANGMPGYIAAIEAAGGATGSAGDAAAGAATDYSALSKAMKGTLDASFTLEEAEDKQASSIQALSDKLNEQRQAHGKLGLALQGQTEDARNNRAALRDLIADTEDLAIANSEAGKPVGDLKDKLRDQLVAMGLSADQIQPYLDKLDQLIGKLNAIPRDVSTNIIVHDSGGQGRNAHAAGGPMGAGDAHAFEGGPRGGWTTMNEQGAERVNLPYGSMVYSAQDTQRMAMGAGQGGGRGDIVIRGDGTPIAEMLIRVLAAAVSARGGRPDLLGLRIENN